MLGNHLVVATAGYGTYIHWASNGNWNFTIELALNWLIVMVGCCLPDIDHPESTLGRRVKLFSYPIQAVFGHRGITHSLIAVAAIFYLGAEFKSTLLSWLSLGYLLHLVGDYLTPSGIPLLYPIRKRYRFVLVAETNSIAEPFLAWAVATGSLMYIYNF